MRFRRLEYQDRVLDTFDTYIERLVDERQRTERAKRVVEQAGLDIPVPDFTERAWEALWTAGRLPVSRRQVPFSPRKTGCGEPVPNAVLKVPTGGGKTWLAVSGVSRIMGRYLGRNTGFVLWVVPSEAIYRQTLNHLRDRQHPYRQALDRAAAGRVLVMEKDDRLHAREVTSNLCVMLLTRQSSSGEIKDRLKMFRDRGDVHGFFPHEGDQSAHREVMNRTPNLDAHGGDLFSMVKDSLGNALRVIRPIIVLDEGHTAISQLAFGTLYGFNPCFVLELSATPKDVRARGGKNPVSARPANVLVEITGRDLDREGMIKIPLNLHANPSSDWKATLNAAVEKLNDLDRVARQFQADTNRYIRPIMLVQAEQTGADQRGKGRIHADDVKEWLVATGFDENEIAIKTSKRNDLSLPENKDLLSPMNRIRVIITKSAIKEGWDCPFAYVLCTLAASSNMTAMTQIVGRILRQPHAVRTGVSALDESYVFTHHARTRAVLGAVKRGLERSGLGDLNPQVNQDSDGSTRAVRRIRRRPAFSSMEIYLPRVMVMDGGKARDLDYGTDILSRIDWRGFDPGEIADGIPENAQSRDIQMRRVGLGGEGGGSFTNEAVTGNGEVFAFDPVHTVRSVSDIVPNPFVGREIVGRFLERLQERGFSDSKVGGIAGLIGDELRQGLDSERNKRAKALFKQEVRQGNIQFRLRLDGRNWRMPSEAGAVGPLNGRTLVGREGEALQRSLFTPVYESEFNEDEKEVAVYLDGEAALSWWHRNVAKCQYGIQGWKRDRIYPDFIFAVHEDGTAGRIIVLETKGDFLNDPEQTGYKRELLSFLSDRFSRDSSGASGELELVSGDGHAVHCELVLMSEWKTRVPSMLSANPEVKDGE